jgi:hypothetical protein
MTKELVSYHRAARAFLARLIRIHGAEAPEVLRRIAQELEWLEEDRKREQHERVALELHSAGFRRNS